MCGSGSGISGCGPREAASVVGDGNEVSDDKPETFGVVDGGMGMCEEVDAVDA